jgi:amidase
MMDATSTAASFRSGELSVTGNLEQSLLRLDEAEKLGAIQWRDDERARVAAKEAEHRFASGTARPLEGIPWTAKELLPIEGIAGLYAMEPFAKQIPPASAWLADTMKDLGAILVARTSSPALGALATTVNHRGSCLNPHDASGTRAAGGSSGGAAVCASLGVAAMNHGSDAGGSIRIPAACCGVIGLKPTRGRISRGPFRGEGWAGLSVEGPLTRTVRDAAWFLDLTHGYRLGDLGNPPTPSGPFIEAAKDDARKRVALSVTRDGLGVSPAAERAVLQAANLLAEQGHEIIEVTPPMIERMEPAFGIASTAGIASMPLTPDQVETLHPRIQRLWNEGQSVPAVELLRELDEVSRVIRELAAWFEPFDVLLTPTLSEVAPVQDEMLTWDWDRLKIFLQWTWPFNVSGQPAISVPFGSDNGLPLGVQAVGKYGDEAQVIAIGHQLESLSRSLAV